MFCFISLDSSLIYYYIKTTLLILFSKEHIKALKLCYKHISSFEACFVYVTQEESCFTSNRNSSQNIYCCFEEMAGNTSVRFKHSILKWRKVEAFLLFVKDKFRSDDQFFTFCTCVVANIYDELVIKMSGGDQPLETSYGRVILKKFLQK